MRYLLIALMLLTSACGKPHSYEVNQCFKLGDGAFYKVADIRNDKYWVKLMLKEIPNEYKDLNDLLPLPFPMSFEEFEDRKLILIDCPR